MRDLIYHRGIWAKRYIDDSQFVKHTTQIPAKNRISPYADDLISFHIKGEWIARRWFNDVLVQVSIIDDKYFTFKEKI